MKRLVTVVTGGSRGIGAATCRRLAEDGHDVVVGYLGGAQADEEAREVAEAVRRTGARSVCVRGDTSVEAVVERLFTAAERQLGPVTGLVNNAGVTGPFGRLADTDPSELRRVVEVNFLGTLLCSRRAARVMTARGGGVIVNVSSSAATFGGPGDHVHTTHSYAYAATKAAVDILTLGLAEELRPDGIRVNAVAPDRPARPEEVAAAIAWLMSPEASYATGTVVRVSGGR
ncbi:SDR family NAD(P)-dependent oxidoreductase [Streptomyces sp. NPDC101776]|uniref:SDR family NAD(P)-dependent oxidoreductase n=1 Tax=Streptomyces sp. NPDC101776 TaxID=3366146 RepID=UPI00381D32B7